MLLFIFAMIVLLARLELYRVLFLPYSDLALYLPECKHSMPFVVAAKGGSEEPESHTIPLFSACDGVTGAVLYTGGPVWSMDWLPVEGETTEHYVALAAYKGLDEVGRIFLRELSSTVLWVHVSFVLCVYSTVEIHTAVQYSRDTHCTVQYIA